MRPIEAHFLLYNHGTMGRILRVVSAKYFYAVGGKRQGPVSLDELKSLAARQELKRSALLWTEGMPAWQPAGQNTAVFEGLPPDLDTVVESKPAPPPQPQPPALPAETEDGPNPLKEYLQVIKKYAVFEGRAGRQEFWSFFFVNLAIMIVFAIVDGLNEDGPHILRTIYLLAVVLPYIGVAIRRMHDTDRSGWWILLPIGNFIYWAEAGKPGNNRFGPNPKIVSS
jgi:uncharacterized membrane protein YhaH (DUF805 family)